MHLSPEFSAEEFPNEHKDACPKTLFKKIKRAHKYGDTYLKYITCKDINLMPFSQTPKFRGPIFKYNTPTTPVVIQQKRLVRNDI